MAPSERADVMAALSGLIQAKFQDFATTITEENGSPVSWSVMGQVFSATMVSERDRLGDRVTEWLEANPSIQAREIVVTQSSDEAFHCLAITVFYWEPLR